MHALVLAFFIILLFLMTLAGILGIVANFISTCTYEHLKKQYISGHISREEFLNKKNDVRR